MTDSPPNKRAHLLRKILIDLSLLTVIGTVLAIIGPFGSFQMPFAMRLISWLGLAYIGYAFYGPIDSFAVRYGPRLDLPIWGMRVAACFIATIPMAAVVWIVGYLPLAWPIPAPSLQDAVITYGYVLVIGALITGIFTLLNRGSGIADDQSSGDLVNPDEPTLAAKVDSVVPKFFDRIPARLGNDLIALEMQDHYLRIHTELGSELVHMRMCDAVDELDGIDGALVHRSWWVAREAVVGSKKDGRNMRLLLKGDLEAPVARSNVSELKEQGWF